MCVYALHVYILYMVSVHIYVSIHSRVGETDRSLEAVGQFSQSVDTRVSERHKEK